VASEYGDTEVAQGLLELGVNLNSRDNEGRTPLQVALDKDNEQVVQILLQHGAQRT
jgi:ankyrin repeat protein